MRIEAPRSWLARLELAYARQGSRTAPVRRWHTGPLRVQKCLFPEGDGICQQILVHPPGGVAGGDRLEIDVDVRDHAWAQVTTPGAGKWYKSAGTASSGQTHLRVAEGATLEWLPQEQIVYDGAEVSQSLEIDLHTTSRFFGWEILVLGRRASNESFTRGTLRSRWEVRLNGEDLAWESGVLQGSDERLAHAIGWRNHHVSATVWAWGVPTQTEIVDPQVDGVIWGTTRLDGLVVGRALGSTVEDVRKVLEKIWSQLRPAMLEREAINPRIWNT